MNGREQYTPSAAFGAEVNKGGENWTLILVRELKHAPTKVWTALTDPEQLREWSPFDADRNLGSVGPAMLTTVGAPAEHITKSQVTRADAPRTLEYAWGGNDIRWELEPLENGGTRVTLWHNINREYVAMGASGWHIAFDVLDRMLAGHPIGRIVGPEAFKFDWRRLYAEYSKQFGENSQPSNS
jgi:uncharacterized protein YndB with AHSA1/START domain